MPAYVRCTLPGFCVQKLPLQTRIRMLYVPRTSRWQWSEVIRYKALALAKHAYSRASVWGAGFCTPQLHADALLVILNNVNDNDNNTISWQS